MEWESDSPILPIPTIVPDLSFPSATLPHCAAVSERKLDFSPFMCLEQPLSTYHSWLFPGMFSKLFAGLFAVMLFPLTLAFSLSWAKLSRGSYSDSESPLALRATTASFSSVSSSFSIKSP